MHHKDYQLHQDGFAFNNPRAALRFMHRAHRRQRQRQRARCRALAAFALLVGAILGALVTFATL